MKVHQGLENFKKLSYGIVTSGTFDGVHQGHIQILDRLKSIKKSTGGETLVITYWPHPRMVLHPEDNSLKLLSTLEEKMHLLSIQGVDHLVIIPFTAEFSQLSSEEFIRNILVEKIGTRKLVIGYDHKFGKNREGSFEHLLENSGKYGFEVEEIPAHEVDAVTVSSTKIRNALLRGEVEIAEHYLGRYYSFTGKVTDGLKIGKKIGFPTANLIIEHDYKLIPKDGIYSCLCKTGKVHKGMIYIGERPTLSNASHTVEVNLFDFQENLYGENITVTPVKFLREDQKFDNLQLLSEQIAIDEKNARQSLLEIPLSRFPV
jgi:riboflavin kinase / FMN adenylyltransferase